jgi:CRP-like cAMP-binding protein
MVELDVLRRYPFFKELDTQNLKEIALITQQKTVPAGTVMFRVGDPADTFYVIVKGKVEILYPVGENKRLGMHILEDGDLLVWSAIVPPYVVKTMGTTLEDTLLLAIDAQKLREFFEVDPVLAYLLVNQVATMLGERLENARQKFATMFENLEEMLHRSRAELERHVEHVV